MSKYGSFMPSLMAGDQAEIQDLQSDFLYESKSAPSAADKQQVEEDEEEKIKKIESLDSSCA